jgi:hypothetical protein
MTSPSAGRPSPGPSISRVCEFLLPHRPARRELGRLPLARSKSSNPEPPVPWQRPRRWSNGAPADPLRERRYVSRRHVRRRSRPCFDAGVSVHAWPRRRPSGRRGATGGLPSALRSLGDGAFAVSAAARHPYLPSVRGPKVAGSSPASPTPNAHLSGNRRSRLPASVSRHQFVSAIREARDPEGLGLLTRGRRRHPGEAARRRGRGEARFGLGVGGQL